MGIRFRCHHCEHELHVKDFQAGKRGRCPECQGRFRIPASDAAHSLALESFPSASSSTDSDNPQPVHAAHDNRITAQASSGSQPRGNRPATMEQNRPALEGIAAETKKAPRSAATRSKSDKPTPKSKPQTTAPAPSATKGPGASEPRPDANESRPNASSVVGPPPSQVAVLPAAVTDFPNSIWHVRPASGGQYGPAPADVFTQWLIEGRVDPQAWVWRDDWQDWQQANLVFSEYYQTSGLTSPPKSTLPTPPPPTSSVPLAPAAPESADQSAISPVAPLAEPHNPRRDRRRRQRQRNIVIVSVLAVIFVGLLVSLAVVLFSQAGGS